MPGLFGLGDDATPMDTARAAFEWSRMGTGCLNYAFLAGVKTSDGEYYALIGSAIVVGALAGGIKFTDTQIFGNEPGFLAGANYLAGHELARKGWKHWHLVPILATDAVHMAATLSEGNFIPTPTYGGALALGYLAAYMGF